MRRVHWWRVLGLALILAPWVIISVVASMAHAAIYAPTAESVWIRNAVRASEMPLPPGAVTIEVGETEVNGRPAGGYWDGMRGVIRLDDRSIISLMHELGHAFDSRALAASDRARLLDLLGYSPDTSWNNPARWAPGGDMFCAEIVCPDEVIADAYAGCALGYVLLTPDGRGGSRALTPREDGSPWWGSMNWVTTPQRYERICQTIREVGVEHGMTAPAARASSMLKRHRRARRHHRRRGDRWSVSGWAEG